MRSPSAKQFIPNLGTVKKHCACKAAADAGNSSCKTQRAAGFTAPPPSHGCASRPRNRLRFTKSCHTAIQPAPQNKPFMSRTLADRAQTLMFQLPVGCILGREVWTTAENLAPPQARAPGTRKLRVPGPKKAMGPNKINTLKP